MLNGHKTFLGAAGLIMLGLARIVIGLAGFFGTMYPDTVEPLSQAESIDHLQAGAGLIAAGLAAAGIGHKIVKSDAQRGL